MQDKAGTRAPVLGSGRLRLRGDPRLGHAAGARSVGQHARRRRGRAGPHLRAPHRARDQRQRRHRSSCSTTRASSSARGAREFRGVAHGLHLRKEGTDEFLYLTVNAANPKATPQPATAGGRGEDDAEGRDRLEDPGPARHRGLPARTRRRGRSATTRPTSRSRRTATSTSATATGRTTSISTTSNGGVHPHVRRQGSGRRASSPSRTASGSTPAAGAPVLVVADRRNNRLQRFTLDGKHIDFVPGFRLPCHFDEQQGHGGDPRSARPRHADGQGQRDRRAPRRLERRRTGTTRCAREPRDKFIPGQFICPHGACFDHDGNIFVVEWVEVGRVTKLRRV